MFSHTTWNLLSLCQSPTHTRGQGSLWSANWTTSMILEGNLHKYWKNTHSKQKPCMQPWRGQLCIFLDFLFKYNIKYWQIPKLCPKFIQCTTTIIYIVTEIWNCRGVEPAAEGDGGVRKELPNLRAVPSLTQRWQTADKCLSNLYKSTPHYSQPWGSESHLRVPASWLHTLAPPQHAQPKMVPVRISHALPPFTALRSELTSAAVAAPLTETLQAIAQITQTPRSLQQTNMQMRGYRGIYLKTQHVS